MNSEILFRECKEHKLETIAINMNPDADPSFRHCCFECLKDPLKSQDCQRYQDARQNLQQIKKSFKCQKELQINNNIQTLSQLDQNINKLKLIHVQIFNQIHEAINLQIQKTLESFQVLDNKLAQIDLDEYLSNTHTLATENQSNESESFQEECSRLLEELVKKENQEQFISELNCLNNQAILLINTKKFESSVLANKKKILISSKCQLHDEEMRIYDENQQTAREDRIICEECSIDRKGPFRTILSIYKEWELYKDKNIKMIMDTKQEQNQRLDDVIKMYKEYQKDFENGINETLIRLEKQKIEKNVYYDQQISKLNQDWPTLNVFQIIKITEILTQPILKEKKESRRKSKLQNQVDEINQELKTQLAKIKQIHQRNQKKLILSINEDNNLFTTEQEIQVIQETNSIQCQIESLMKNERVSNISYINEIIMKLIIIADQLKQQKEKKALIKNQFDYFSNIHSIINIYQERVEFNEFFARLYMIIKEKFPNYYLNTNKMEEEKIQNQMSKQIVESILNAEVILDPQIVLNVEESHLFSIVDDQYQKNFYRNFSDKLKALEKQIINHKQIYQIVVVTKWITKLEFQDYIEKEMVNELYAYCWKQQDYDKRFDEFLQSFTVLGLEIDQENANQLKIASKQWFAGEKLKKQLPFCFKQIEGQQQLLKNQLHQSFITKNCPKFLQYLYQKEVLIDFKDEFYWINQFKQSFNDDKMVFEYNQYVVTIKNIDDKLIQVQNNRHSQQQFNETSKQRQNQLFEIFNYILYPNQSQANFNFLNNIVPLIQQLLSSNNNEGWKIFFNEIHKLTLEELISFKGISSVIINDEKNLFQSLFLMFFQRFLEKIEIKISELNEYFSNFGVIFNDQGKKIILKYSLYVISKFLCFDKHLQEQKVHQQQQISELQYQRFSADVLDELQEKSKLNGKLLAVHIYQEAKLKYYHQYSSDLPQILERLKCEELSFDLIKKLDNEILLRQDKNITDQQVLDYITDQSKYVIKYVNPRIQSIKQDMIQLYSNDLIGHLQKVQQNINHLCQFQDPQKYSDYFDELMQPDLALDLIKQLIVGCLQGSINQILLDRVKQEYRDRFQRVDFYQFFDPLCNYNRFDLQIHDLSSFVEGFIGEINSIQEEINNFQNEPEKHEIQFISYLLELNLIGCLELCPMCRRKCDYEINEINHVHQCRNGHQLLGIKYQQLAMNGNVGQSLLFSCEELYDQQQVQDAAQIKQSCWKDLKLNYKEWIFSYQSIEKQKQYQVKFQQIWNDSIGSMLCSQPKGFPKTFQKRKVLLNQSTKYILILDVKDRCDQGYLNSLKTSFHPFLQIINNNPNNKITIILYKGIESLMLVDDEFINNEEEMEKIQYKSSFIKKEALTLAYERIIQNFDQFDEHQILLYIAKKYEGKEHKELFKSILLEDRKKIRTITNSAPLSCFFEQEGYGTFTKFIDLEQLGQNWIDTLPLLL